MARKKYKDHLGERFGRLVVIRRAPNSAAGDAMWHCLCDCGNKKIVMGSNLRAGNTRSCGCFVIKHGLASTPLYRVWAGMKERCSRKNNAGYKNYGGRGIIDNDGDYTPENCRFTTAKENCRNSRINIKVAVYDKVSGDSYKCRSLSEASEITGLNAQRIRRNMDRGYLEKRYLFLSI